MKLKSSFFSRLMRPFLATAAFASLVLSVNAAGYMKLGDIKGEATDSEHKEWINLLSVSQGLSRPATTDPATGQRRRGDVILDDIVVVKELDKSSPKLMEAVCNGTIIPEVEIVLTRDVKNKQEPYLKYKLTNVIVTSYSLGNTNNQNGQLVVSNIGSSGMDGVRQEDPTAGEPAPAPAPAPEKPAPTTVSFNYGEIQVIYTEYDKETGAAKGNIEYNWKVEEGVK